MSSLSAGFTNSQHDQLPDGLIHVAQLVEQVHWYHRAPGFEPGLSLIFFRLLNFTNA